MPCWHCGGMLNREPARIVCRNCGREAPRRTNFTALRLQLLMDYALMPRGLAESTDAHSPEEYAVLVGAYDADIAPTVPALARGWEVHRGEL